MNLAEWLRRAAQQHPDRPAVLLGDQCLHDYAALAGRVARLAAGLQQQLGLQPGERIALFLGNQPAYLELLYAAWWAGLAVVPVNAKLHVRELTHILADSEAAAVCVPAWRRAELAPAWDGLPTLRQVISPDDAGWPALFTAHPLTLVHRAPDDLAWLFYTSGTTGRPKGVMQTHGNLQAMTACYFIDVDEVSPEDAVVYAAPLSHGAGLYNLPFMRRAARHVLPASGGFDPAELIALSHRIGRLCLFAAPTMVKRLVDEVRQGGASPDGFKTIVYGGGPMYAADIREALAVMGPRFVQIYGQGESPMTITALSRAVLQDAAHPRHAARIASVGVAQSLVEVQVVDEQGQALPAGQTGEVVVRGSPVMAGYWRNPAATEAALRGGWLWTGDLGVLDADGFLTLKDRSKDVVISGGSNIYPREVEEVLLLHPGVREVSVVGEPDAEWGEVVVAFVVGEVADLAELDALCLAHIARFKRPRRYHVVDSLPKNHYGKVLKTALRERLKGP